MRARGLHQATQTRRSLVNSDADCMPATVRTPASADHVHSRASVQHDYTSFGGSSSITPADATVALIGDLIAQPSDEHGQRDTSAEGNFISRSSPVSAVRPMPGAFFKSDRRSFNAAIPDCAGRTLPVPLHVVPSPACPLLAFHRAPTVDYPSQEVCMKLRSSSCALGITPAVHSDSEHVQLTPHSAVDGPANSFSSSDIIQSF